MLIKFTPNDLKKEIGATYYQRAVSYYQQGRVTEMKQFKNMISGEVEGSSENIYGTLIALNHEGKIMDSKCTCPLGGYCKHVGALGLKALAGNKKEFSEDPWSLQLKKALHESKSFTQKKSHVQLIIHIEQAKANPYQKKEVNTWRMAFRPRFFNARSQKYSVTELGWKDIYYKSESWMSLPPQEAEFIKKIAGALSGNEYWSSYAATWKYLVEEKTDYLWHLLKQHQNYGVELVCGDKYQNKVILHETPLRAELILGENGQDLILEKHFFYKEEKFPIQNFMLVGNPPQWAIHFTHPQQLNQGDMEFYPLEGDPKLFQNFESSIVIPPNKIERFKKEFLPTLTREYKITNASSKITLPKYLTPQIQVKVTHEGDHKIHTAFHLKYGDKLVPLNHQGHEIEMDDGETILCHPEEAEKKVNELKKQLSSLSPLWKQGEDHLLSEGVLERMNAADFLNRIVVDLAQQEDIELDLADDLPQFKQDYSEPEVTFNMGEGVGDWFDLNINVSVGENNIPFSQIFTALSKKEDHIFLENGTYFALDHERFKKLNEMIQEAGKIKDVSSEGISLSRFQAGLWEELKKLGIVSQQAEAWEKAMQGLMNFKEIEAQPHSKKLKATLRSYQKEGYHWLHFLYTHGLGGVLADDMGLGKTLQAIALMDYIKEIKKEKGAITLVVGPTSVVESWAIELERFAPHLKTVVMRAGNRSESFKEMKKADVVVTSYSLLHRDFEILKAQPFTLMILDEAQHLKNHQSKAYSAARKMDVKVRLALTGTPMENNTLELWSVFSIVAPGLFPSVKHFVEEYQKPIEKEGNQERLDKLRSRIRPFIVRRKKELVAKDLPAKTEQMMVLEMDKKQRKIYDLHLQRERQRVLGLMQNGGIKQNRFEIFRSLTRMRQLCLHAGLVDKKNATIPSVKLDRLMEKLEDIVSEGHRVLVFSQFTSFLSYVKERLEAEGMEYLYLDGATKRRGDLIKKFQSEKGPSIFLISLKAGGSGLTLTAADYCIMLDPWWNPAVENQAIDRTHRIGQKKKVFVYKMIVKDSIEEKVVKLQEKKKVLFDSVLEEGGKFGSAITEEDIRGIFE